jgi:DNA processing protein
MEDLLEEGSVDVIPMTSPRYPTPLLALVDPPPLLFLKGDLKLLQRMGVAVVGSRKATGVGRRAAETLGRELGAHGIPVVSGMALGIDGEAHRGALQVGGRTIAVLGSGFKRVYPAAHRRLFHEIGQKGLLLTEFFPAEPALPHHFPKRNRIIAALSRAIVVVEAGRRSGALITVDHGLDLGKEILVVPGSVENLQTAGSNALLKDGATALPDPRAIVGLLKELGLASDLSGAGASSHEGPAQSIPEDLVVLWGAISEEPRSVEDLAVSASVPLSEALAGLSVLELGGWVRQCPGMRYHRYGPGPRS